MVHTSTFNLIGATLLLVSVTAVLAHGHDDHAAGTGPSPSSTPATDMGSSSPLPQSYFSYPASGGLMLGHVILMTLAWVFILPIGELYLLFGNTIFFANQCILGVMLSVAQSRSALPVQLSFLGLHTIALLLGTVYRSRTPDLYENNAHNKIGWIVTWTVAAQSIIGIVKLAVSFQKTQDVDVEEKTSYMPMSTQAMVEHQQATYSTDEYRYSRDSGHYTASEASRSQSVSSMQDQDNRDHHKFLRYQNSLADTDAEYTEEQGSSGNTKAQRLAVRIAAMMSQRTMRVLNVAYNTVDCLSLPFGFIQIVSGTVVYGGIFVSSCQYQHPTYC